jgi:hypothetical protein
MFEIFNRRYATKKVDNFCDPGFKGRAKLMPPLRVENTFA